MRGNVRAELPSPLNADISASTTNGVIKSELAGPLTASGNQFKTRLGTGESVLSIVSNKGTITLAMANSNSETPVSSEAPRLVGSEVPLKSAGTPANESSTEDVSEGDVIRVDSQLATLNMSVVDQKTNRGVIGLTQQDFQLFENGKEQEILQFESASAPFDLLLLIDVSGSTRDVVKLIRSAALRFVAAARPSDRIAIISFAGQQKLVSPLTLDRDVLRQRIETIDTAAGDTKVYDAVDFALKHISAAKNSSRRSAVVLMSDGLDGNIPSVQGEGSTLSYPELLSSVREFDGILYSLWLNTEYESVSPLDTQPEAFDMGHDRTLEMAEAGGGVFYKVERLEDLAGTYERVVADLGTVYSLAYRPTNKSRDGKWRAIRVTVDRPSAIARGKRGYYAN
jgi:VWFA-related protein